MSAYPNVNERVLGFGKSIPRYKVDGLQAILDEGESILDSYPNRQFVTWYRGNKPDFFRLIDMFEKLFENKPDLGVGIIIHPKTIELVYGYIKQNLYLSYRHLNTAMLGNIIQPFIEVAQTEFREGIKTILHEKSIRILAKGGDLELFRESIQDIYVKMDQFEAGIEC